MCLGDYNFQAQRNTLAIGMVTSTVKLIRQSCSKEKKTKKKKKKNQKKKHCKQISGVGNAGYKYSPHIFIYRQSYLFIQCAIVIKPHPPHDYGRLVAPVTISNY